MNIIFNMYKIKFNTLDRLLNEANISINHNDTVNVYINLESVLDTLANADVEKYLSVNTPSKIFDFISNVLNLAAHYRLFFSKNKIFSRIYLYMTYPFNIYYKNSNIVDNYRNYYKTKFGQNINTVNINEVITNSMNYLKIITEYIQNVYIIESGETEGSLVPLIVKDNDKDINFMVSKELYDYQYVNKNFFILRPKKQDKSYLISKQNLPTVLQTENNSKDILKLDPGHLSFILSVLGDKKRNLPKIRKIGLGRIIKSINTAINNKILPESVYNINIIASLLKEEDKKTLMSNYYCIDLDTQYKLLNKKNIYEITDQLKDKFDNQSLKELNYQYFIQHPINLVELTSGDKFKCREKLDIF